MRLIHGSLLFLSLVLIPHTVAAQRNWDYRYFQKSMQHSNLSHRDLRIFWFQLTDLYGANLEESNFSGTSFVDADLSHANLRSAILSKTCLNYARVRRANLEDADLRYANLLYTDFKGADLRGANLRNAEVDATNFTGAIYDNRTKWPRGFRIATSGAIKK